MEDFVRTNTLPPVLLIVFNRPHKAIQVFEKIRQVRPPKLFIVADGPRPNRPGEEELVRQCRALKDLVDWDCDLKVNFAKTNMGCHPRLVSGITWAFEHVEELIILEDDCVPNLTFFRFCQEMLEKYRNDTRVFSIGGYNYDQCEPFDESYAFSKRFDCWGWATWKRAWKFFDMSLKYWPTFRQDKYMKNAFSEDNLKSFNDDGMFHMFQLDYDGAHFAWDNAFNINCLMNHALQIIPRVNLIRNTGFESGGTHIGNNTIWHLYMDEPIEFPLTHPQIVFPISRLFGPPVITEDTPENINKLTHIFTEYDATFKRLLQHNQYNEVIDFFKKNVLRDRVIPIHRPLTPYHLNYAYYVAIAYFNLGDYEHAEAMLDIVLAVDKKNVDLLLFMAQVQLVRRNFGKFYNFIDTLSQLDATTFTKEQTALLGRMLDALN